VLSRLASLALLLPAFGACQKESKGVPHEVAQTVVEASSQSGPNGSGSAKRRQHVPLAGERVEIPTGAFEAGSVPGTEGRHPQTEQLVTSIELGPYQIDKLPYPNDPALPPLTNVTRAEAMAHCASRGARLCTELEWERACKGPNSEAYSTGARFEPECQRKPNDCASGFEVLSLGIALREFTASDVIAQGSGAARGVALRGASEGSPRTDHRCAHRDAGAESERGLDLGFRCCHGPPNAIRVEEPHQLAVFDRAKLELPAAIKLLESDPKTAHLAKEFTFFREPEAAETVVSRGPGDRQGLRFTVAPLLWSPVAGTRYLLLLGRSGKDTSVVLSYYVIREGEYRLASSFVMKNEPGPIAFAHHESIRPRLFFSSCWKCPGETGRILYREPDSIAIVQP